MPNTETLRALVSAFNVHNYARNTVETNFTLQSRGKKDYIVVSFDKSMDTYQCSEYLDSIKRKMIREFYGIKESNDAEILDTAKLIFDVNSFPFNISDRDWSWDEQHGLKFVTPIDQGVIFNLKSHLAASLAKDVIEDMPTCNIRSSDRKDYLWQGEFDNKGLRKEFEREFLSRMKERYKNVPKNPLKIEGNDVYIKDVFDDARFIDSVTRYIAWLEGMGLQDDSKNYSEAKAFKDLIMEFIDQSIGLTVAGFIRNFPLNEKTAKILIPVVLDNGEPRILASEEALELNCAFNYAVFNDLYGKTQGELSVNGSSGIYGIDFSNKEISHCVITKIIESSVINKDHELAIDPELVRALSPAQSQVGMPNGPSSSLTGTSTQGFPTQSRDGALKESPRQALLSVVPLNPLDIPETSREFLPPTQLSFPTVSCGVPVSSSSLRSVGAAQNVPAGTSAWDQPIGAWSSPAPSAEPSLWQPSRPSSSKGANPVGTNRWSLLAPSAGLRSLPQSGPSSWKGANPVGTNPWAQQMNHWSSSKDADKGMLAEISACFPWTQSPQPLIEPVSSCSFRQEPSVLMVNTSSSSGWKISNELPPSNKLNDKEKELFKALLYVFNLRNFTSSDVYTNFFVKGEKIVSLLHDNVDREKYLQAVIGYIIKEYCEDEEEARKVYDFDEFPFKLNYEEKQEKTVVANISSGALSNLKILFSQKFGKNVDAIDISAVKKVEKREKDESVDCHLEEACEGCFPDKEAIEEACKVCFPDEGVMKIIPIAFDEEEGEYVLDRSRDTCEVNLLLKEQLRRFRDTSLEKRKSSDKPLTEEEKELFKKLLYAFNLNNYIFECHNTNFIVENGKIASSIDDSVNVKEYLQEVRSRTIEKYCGTEEEAKEPYDLNEFPFKFLSNCEKNQETTVVANISSGALLNLKKLFIYRNEKEVEIGDIDIKIVEKVVESKRRELVNSDVKKIEEKEGHHVTPYELVTTSYPDESALEDIPIKKYETGCCLDRTFNNWETKSLLEELGRTKNRSKTKKMKLEDNKDSGISSGEATDAENVSSKAEATTSGSSGYEYMDCENTGKISPKRTLELSVGMEELVISTDLDATKTEQHSPIKKFRSN